MVDWRGGRREPQNEGQPLERAIGALRALPPLDRDAVSRIVATAARAREHDTEPQIDDLPPARPRMIRWPAVATIAAAAAIVGFLAGSGERHAVTVKATADLPPMSAVPPSLPPQTAAPLAAALPVAATSVDLTAVPTQFVFDARGAKRVALVGAFNGWDERAIPLEREAGSSLWSVTVPLLPGRHVYAFLVDSVWTTDPRAPKSRDPDFGVTGSVVIVGVP